MDTFDYILAKELVDDEGFELKSYTDTKGNWTIGVGHLLGKGASFSNITWTSEKVMITFMQDLNVTIYHCEDQIQIFDSLSINRQRVLVNMMFNLGPSKFAGFVEFKKHMMRRDYRRSYDEMLNSKWAKNDVPERANRLAARWLNG